MYQSLSKKFIEQGIGPADCLYSMYFENIEFVRYAKDNSLKIVIDIYENPKAFKALINEINEHKEYAIFSTVLEEFEGKSVFREKYINEMLRLADYYTVPSMFVKNSLRNYSGYDENKVNIIPYPSSIQVKKYNYRPVTHKLIWVGNDAVRKGLIYCAKAATILKIKYPNLQFKIIGSIDDKIKKADAFSDLTFIGVMDKKSLIEEFETAEAYVFPTLFEGFAGTVIEAASCGCPVITTENSGMSSIEFPGVFIPEKNVEAIVDSVISLFENRNLRNKLSKDSYNYSNNLSPENYEHKLINFFKGIG
jgi:glycosyltransferase involved in cell wall biosynthesis